MMDIPVTAFSRYPEIVSVYLFGSRARGENDEKSDWDYAVLTKSAPISTDSLLKLIGELEIFHKTRVDVVDLRSAPPLLKHRVIRDRTVIYDLDPLLRVNFETRAILEYLDWELILELHGFSRII